MRFLRKSIEVQAEQLLWSNWSGICELAEISVGGRLLRGLTPSEVSIRFPSVAVNQNAIYVLVPSRERNCLASEGDWIIRDEHGMLLVRSPDAFELEYEAMK